ncbi:chromatin assembly factor 1 subunit A [Pelomyxa schiedti]|nr:chromatin assembly factor 1 subunit A [Pelomyxa schiedti]
MGDIGEGTTDVVFTDSNAHQADDVPPPTTTSVAPIIPNPSAASTPTPALIPAPPVSLPMPVPPPVVSNELPSASLTASPHTHSAARSPSPPSDCSSAASAGAGAGAGAAARHLPHRRRSDLGGCPRAVMRDELQSLPSVSVVVPATVVPVGASASAAAAAAAASAAARGRAPASVGESAEGGGSERKTAGKHKHKHKKEKGKGKGKGKEKEKDKDKDKDKKKEKGKRKRAKDKDKDKGKDKGGEAGGSTGAAHDKSKLASILSEIMGLSEKERVLALSALGLSSNALASAGIHLEEAAPGTSDTAANADATSTTKHGKDSSPKTLPIKRKAPSGPDVSPVGGKLGKPGKQPKVIHKKETQTLPSTEAERQQKFMKSFFQPIVQKQEKKVPQPDEHPNFLAKFESALEAQDVDIVTIRQSLMEQFKQMKAAQPQGPTAPHPPAVAQPAVVAQPPVITPPKVQYISQGSPPLNMALKLFLFSENVRPPYRGTWSKTSKVISGRKPLNKDPELFDYDCDSGVEFEDVKDADDIPSDDNKDKEEEIDVEETPDDKAFVVDDGYLSPDEGGGISCCKLVTSKKPVKGEIEPTIYGPILNLAGLDEQVLSFIKGYCPIKLHDKINLEHTSTLNKKPHPRTPTITQPRKSIDALIKTLSTKTPTHTVAEDNSMATCTTTSSTTPTTTNPKQKHPKKHKSCDESKSKSKGKKKKKHEHSTASSSNHSKSPKHNTSPPSTKKKHSNKQHSDEHTQSPKNQSTTNTSPRTTKPTSPKFKHKPHQRKTLELHAVTSASLSPNTDSSTATTTTTSTTTANTSTSSSTSLPDAPSSSS